MHRNIHKPPIQNSSLICLFLKLNGAKMKIPAFKNTTYTSVSYKSATLHLQTVLNCSCRSQNTSCFLLQPLYAAPAQRQRPGI